jgi:tyrosine-protein phosphatase
MSTELDQRRCLQRSFSSKVLTSSCATVVAPLSSLPNANSRTLKGSSIAAARPTPHLAERLAVSNTVDYQGGRSKQRAHGASVHPIVSRGRRQYQPLKMPSAAGPRVYESHIPSFMSVYDMDPAVVESPVLGPAPKLSGATHTIQQPLPQSQHHESEKENPQIHSHQYRESTSTQASDSTDSSPTTTISTVGSSSLSDPSPSSSPESPITLVPLSSFSGSTFGLDSFQSLKMVDSNPSRLPLNDDRPMTSPSPRKPKNPKSLALNLNPSTDAFQSSEPSSPSFIKPPTLKGRRKPSLLSLNTGAANNLSLALEPVGSPGIPTMLQRRSLKHSISSPQMLSTPSFGPTGGMTLGERKPIGSRFKESNLTMNTFTIDEDVHEAPTGVQMATRIPGVAVGGDSFDRPHSGEDAKSPSYPEGPILMHEPNVHLYLEPKIEEAMQFDVIINVAREVKNPFKAMEMHEAKKEDSEPKLLDRTELSPDASDIPPDTAATMLSYRTAFEVQPSSSTESSPTTPKPSAEKKLPEYIHVPWDHNTDVKDELWDLCQTIEARTKEGKKVLVHCQQGASRSATLIIAYGMYINQDLGPNEAYSLAQSKSRWVNPNMSLLFSLNDFKKVIERKKAEKNNPIRKPTVKHRPTLSADTLDPPPTPSRARGNSTPNASARDNALAKPEENLEPQSISNSAIERLGGFDFGFGEISISNEWEDLLSPRVTEMTSNPLQSFSRSFGSDAEVPPTPNVFSPRNFEFPRSSFFHSPTQRASLALDEDPRSPPTKGEAPITRSIDDFL